MSKSGREREWSSANPYRDNKFVVSQNLSDLDMIVTLEFLFELMSTVKPVVVYLQQN